MTSASQRDRAFSVSPYPCIGQVRFLGDRWATNPYFQNGFLPRLRAGATLLDVGCGLGQEIRFLVFDYGIDSSRLYATDIEARLIDLGYELFRDRDRLKATFFAADILDPAQSEVFDRLRGGSDLIHASHFFHVWDWEGQITVAKNVAALSRGPGAMVAGMQIGSKDAGSYAMFKVHTGTGAHYRHSAESWKRFWKQVGNETGTKWRAEYHEMYSQAIEESRDAWWAKNDPGMTVFCFTVTRLRADAEQ